MIHGMLRSDDYLGHATWNWTNGESYTIEIPQFLPEGLWQCAQEQLQRNKTLALRNAKGVYLLQGILYCGECGRRMSMARQRYWYRRQGRERVLRTRPYFAYYCSTPKSYPEEKHANPHSHGGAVLDWAVWRHLVDFGIRQPDIIQEQIQVRRTELQAQGGDLDSEIARALAEVAKVDHARAELSRQQAYGKISWQEFEARIAETEIARRERAAEADRLRALRDDAQRVQAGLDYVQHFMQTLQAQVQGIDQEPDALNALPENERRAILEKRRRIIRALCDRVTVWADGRIKIEGVLDGSEAVQFEYASRKNDTLKLHYTLATTMQAAD